jgi:hypothetical protein
MIWPRYIGQENDIIHTAYLHNMCVLAVLGNKAFILSWVFSS